MTACPLPLPSNWSEVTLKKRAFVQPSRLNGDSIDVTSRDAVYTLNRDMIRCFFDVPSLDAARVLRVCMTVLKRIRKWAGVPRWPFTLVNMGIYEMSREDIVRLRQSVITSLEGGGETSFPGVLPLLKEAEALSLVFKTISTPTMYALEDRAKALALREASRGQAKLPVPPRPAESALATKVLAGVFKRPVVRKMQKWVSTAAVCLSEAGPMSLAGEDAVKAVPVEVEEEKEPVQIIWPYTYARECAAPAWIEPSYPPVAEIVDGVEAFWPAMEDPRRIWMQELVCRSLQPSRCGPAITVADLVLSAPVSAAEMRFANGFLEDVSD